MKNLEMISTENLFHELLKRIERKDINREGLQETPARVAKAYARWFGGYGQKPEDVLKVFKDGAEDYDQMIFLGNIPVWSHCEHHMAPFFGVAHIAYIPDGKIVGLSKLSRLTNVFSRRLQVQERLTTQIGDALQDCLEPLGVGVVLECRHTCMESRGIEQQGVVTTTSRLTGCFKGEDATRAEFMSLVNKERHRASI